MNYETKLCLKIASLLFPFFIAVIRLIVVLPLASASNMQQDVKKFSEIPPDIKGSNIMILLGSGGHTGEMIRILSNVNLNNFTRTWVISSGDTTSIMKAKEYEEKNLSESEYKSNYLTIERARKVGEPILSSIKSTLNSFASTVNVLFKLPQLPSVLLLNGPGTSVPLAYILFIMKFLGLCKTKIIYVESLARVNQLSISGLLLLPISDRFIVQWEQLCYKYKRAEYYGILI